MAKKAPKPKKKTTTVVSRLKKTVHPAKPLKRPLPARKPPTRKPAPAKATTPKATETAPKTSRTDELKALLQTSGGVPLVDVQSKFGWLAHSARAAISRAGGVGRKVDGVTRYSMPDVAAAPAS